MPTWPAILLIFGEVKNFTDKLVWQPNNHSRNPSIIRPHLSRSLEWVPSPLGICVVTCVSADIPDVWIKAKIPASLKENETDFSHCGMRGRSVHRCRLGLPQASTSTSRPLPMTI